MSRLLIVLLTAFVVSLSCSGFAQAGDETEDTPAARLFREAWWLETGTGALDKAHDGYKKALAAEGSASIRARALYRMAVVLQRMGRVEEGVRALERLSSEFGDQKELLAKANARLEEWTAEDLRSSFSEWYKRYQYSPAFQSKIVDLVLRLATGKSKEEGAAENELLTIGEPAVPALREHATSANASLRESVVYLLFELGVLPPADALLGTRRWTDEWESYALFMALDGAQKDALRRELAGEHKGIAAKRARWIRGALDGHDGLLARLAADENSDESKAWLEALVWPASKEATLARLRAMVLDDAVDADTRENIAERLIVLRENGHPSGLQDGDAMQWLASPSRGVRRQALYLLASAKRRIPGAWQAAAKAVLANPAPTTERWSAWKAMLWSLRYVNPEEDLTPAKDAASHVFLTRKPQGSESALYSAANKPGDPAAPREVLAHGIETAASQHLQNVATWWWQFSGRGPDALRTLARWARHAATDRVREEAIALASSRVEKGIGDLMAVLEDPKLRRVLSKELFSGLRRNKRIEDLDWDRASLTLLAQAADTHGHRGITGFTEILRGKKVAFETRLGRDISIAFHYLLGNERSRAMLFQAAQAEPEKFDGDIWAMLPKGWTNENANLEYVIGLLDGAWGGWTPEQRRAGLRLFFHERLGLVADEGREAGTRFVKKRLHDSGNDADLKLALLHNMEKPTLQDIRQVFDLSKPEEVDRAVNVLDGLAPTEEVYDAFVLALRPDSEVAYHAAAFFIRGPASRRADLVRRLLASKDESARELALAVLKDEPRRSDIPLLIEALGHTDAAVRLAAASQMVHLYDKAAIKALASAVDDPDGAVQSAVLYALSIIEKREQRKDYWRKFAEGIDESDK